MVIDLKPVFHGACFEADSATILSAPYTRQARPYPARIARTKSAPNPLQNTLHGKRASEKENSDLKPGLVEFVSLGKTAHLGPHSKSVAQHQQGHAGEYQCQIYMRNTNEIIMPDRS